MKDIISSVCVIAAIGVYACYLISALKIVDFKKLLLNTIGIIIGAGILAAILFFIGGALAASKTYPMCVVAAILFFIIAIRFIAPIAGVALVGVIIYFVGDWVLHLLTVNIFSAIVGGIILITAAKWFGYFTYGCADSIRK